MANYGDMKNGFVVEGGGLPVIRAVTRPVIEETWGGDEIEAIPSGVIATGPRSYTDLVCLISLYDVRQHIHRDDKVVYCRSDDGHNPVSMEVLTSAKAGPCRNAEGHPVCPLLATRTCKEARLALVARLPKLEAIVHPDREDRLPEKDEWPEILEASSPALLRATSASLYGYPKPEEGTHGYGYSTEKDALDSLGDRVEVVPLVVTCEICTRGEITYTRLRFRRLPQGREPDPKLVTLRGDVDRMLLPVTIQQFLPTADPNLSEV